MTTSTPPKKLVTGRNEPDQCPELKGAHLIVSVGLKKRWAKKASYWIDIYGKHGGGPAGHSATGMKIVRFYVYRQWSFIKGAVFDNNRELVSGGFLIPTCFTQVRHALNEVANLAGKQVSDKGYEVCDVDIPAEVCGSAWGLMLLSDIDKYKGILFLINDGKPKRRRRRRRRRPRGEGAVQRKDSIQEDRLLGHSSTA